MRILFYVIGIVGVIVSLLLIGATLGEGDDMGLAGLLVLMTGFVSVLLSTIILALANLIGAVKKD